MTTLPTLGVLSIADGRLMGPRGTTPATNGIEHVYAAMSHLIGRPAFTHDLAFYGKAAMQIVVADFPDMAWREEPWTEARDRALNNYGEMVTVPDTWAGAIADDRGPISTLTELSQ